MRKLIILASLLGVCVSEMEAQSVVALHSGGNTFMLSSFESALKMAKTNDTINLPAGEINLGEEFTLNKGVHIFGVGYNPNANKLNQTTKLLGKKLIIASEAEGGSISGIEFKGDISIGSSGKETPRFDISRCYLNNILQTPNSSASWGVFFDENVMHSIFGSDDSVFFVVFKNNIITGTLKNVSTIAYYNIFLNKANDDYLFNRCILDLSYNIFLAEKFAYNPDEILKCSKNVFTQNTDFSDNLKNIPLNQIFNESVTTNFDHTFNVLADYHLIPNSPAKGIALYNRDPGIYGSDSPAKEMGVTSQPQIYDLKLSEMPNIDGKIKLKAVIKAQQN